MGKRDAIGSIVELGELGDGAEFLSSNANEVYLEISFELCDERKYLVLKL